MEVAHQGRLAGGGHLFQPYKPRGRSGSAPTLWKPFAREEVDHHDLYRTVHDRRGRHGLEVRSRLLATTYPVSHITALSDLSARSAISSLSVIHDMSAISAISSLTELSDIASSAPWLPPGHGGDQGDYGRGAPAIRTTPVVAAGVLSVGLPPRHLPVQRCNQRHPHGCGFSPP